jgi:hypothetical protein
MNRAVVLMGAGAALTLVATAVNLLAIDPADWGSGSSFGRSHEMFGDDVTRAVGYTSVVVSALVSVGLWLWMAWANATGKAWARTVATVLGCVYAGSWALGIVVYAIVPDFAGSSWSARLPGYAVSLTTLLAGGYALWLMYRPESQAFYDASSPPRPPTAFPARDPYYPYPPSHGYQPPPPPPPGGTEGR